jgi:hypothetical protein
MISVHLYGELRRYGDQPRPDRDTIVTWSAPSTITVARLLAEIGIPPDEVAHIFLNGRLLKAGSSMAPWLGYQTATDRLPPGGSHWETPVHSGDRLGLFPHRMAMLVV